MSNEKLPLYKKLIFISIALLIPIVLIWVGGEIFVRLNPALVADPVPGAPYDTRLLDDSIGWHVKSNYYWKGDMNDFAGNKYSFSVTTNQYGFRSFPAHKDLNRLKIFIVGDSYTESVEMGDSDLFYSVLQRELPVDIYAYGAAGYGTMQEFMILQKYFNLVKPDIVILQTCSNDFSDNYAGLEIETNYKVGQRRPYMSADGTPFYDQVWLGYKHIRKYSKFLYYLAEKYDEAHGNISKQPIVNSGEKQIVAKDTLYQPFQQSISMSSEVIKKMKEYLSGKATFLVFSADHYEPALSTMKRICNRDGVTYMDSIATTIQRHQENGEVMHSNDGYHWSIVGHKLVAALLKEKLGSVINEKKIASN